MCVVSHAEIIRDGDLGVKEGNQLWILIDKHDGQYDHP